MNKFSVDYLQLQDKVNQKKAYKLADVKDKIRKVAFDVVRFIDSDKIDDLWLIQRNGDDEYIVAMYEDSLEKSSSTPSVKTASLNSWGATSDNSGKFVNIYYKEMPIKKIALSSFGIPSEEAYIVCKYLPSKLAEKGKLYNHFMKTLSDAEKTLLSELEGK